MTKIKYAKAKSIQGTETTIDETEYYEVGAHEVDNMLKKVEEGENETKLRIELIKTSTWGVEK